MSDEKPVLGILVSGQGSNLRAILAACEERRLSADAGVVISDKKEAPALEYARKYQVPQLYLDPKASDRESYDRLVLQELRKHSVDLVILAGYMRIVTPVLIQAYRNRMMNIHPSLLPAFPGLHAQRQALAYGAKVAGCTVHFVDEQVDHGPIILQSAVPVSQDDTEQTLSARILAEEHRLYVRAIQLFAEGRIEVDGRKVVIKEPK